MAVAIERLGAVAEVNGAVEVGMGFDQCGRHRQRVVKVGQRRNSTARPWEPESLQKLLP